MYPHERSLVKQLADKPFAIIGVNSDSDLEEIREIVKEKNLTWRSFQNEQKDGAISDLWGIPGWPTIFLLDAKGTIRYRDVRGSAMDDAIEELLGEMGHEVKIVHEEPKKNRKKKDADDTGDSKETEADETGKTENEDVADKAEVGDKAPEKYRAYSQALIKRYDEDGDGRLNKDEVRSMRRPPVGADANNDGFITAAEIVASLDGENKSSNNSPKKDADD